MSSFLYRLGRAAARGRVLVLALWIVLLAAAGGSAAAFGQNTDDTFSIPGSPSQEALDHLGHVFPQVSGTTAQIVVVAPQGQRVDTATTKRAIENAIDRIEDVDQVATVADPFDQNVEDAISDDGRAALIAVPLDVDQPSVSEGTKSDLTDIGHDLRAEAGHGVTVHVGGDALANKVPKLSIVEALGLVIALVVLALVFRSIIAATMPLLTAVLGVGVAVAFIFATTAVMPVSSTAPMLAVMLGLAVGIDYALFILSRHRDQLADGLPVEESVARATATAGSAVIFAGLTVIIALVGLFVARIPFLTTMGVAAAFAVTVAVAVAVTLVPALLGFAGERLRPKVHKPRKRKERTPLSLRWVRLVTRVPLVTVLVVGIGLAVCAIPAAQLRLALPDNGSEATGSPARDTYDAIGEHFGPGYNGPLIVTVDIIASTDPVGVTNEIADEIEKDPGVAAVPLATPNEKADTGIIQVVPKTPPDSPQTDRLVERIRSQQDHFDDEYGTDTAVTGITAIGIDVSAQLGKALLPFGVLVVGLSLVLLAMVFRSVWVPIKASLGYLLSVGAAFGATSFVFQQGHLANALNVAHTGSVISFLPIILMGVLFGLAMDYEVFLVSRIREDYARGGDAHAAIESGFVSASRVVIAAALIMFAVFASFVPHGTSSIQPIAFSLAVGVFVDAFLVRMTFVPAVLALLGRRAWWLPGWLDRKLPVFDAEGDSLVHELRLADWPAPDSTEVVSARELGARDDRGRRVFSDVEAHLRPGEVLGIHGQGPVGKSALLYAMGGRVKKVDGDLKVLGRVVPQHSHSVRRHTALIACRDTETPADEARAALEDGLRLILLDDLDMAVRADQRSGLRELFEWATSTGNASFAFTCQNPRLLHDVVPQQGFVPLAMSQRQPVEVV